MNTKKSNGIRKGFPFRALEISLGVIILVLTLFEPLSHVHQSIRQENDVPIAVPEVAKNVTATNGIKIHPWVPALTGTYVKPLLREAAILVIFQNVGVPLIGKFRTQLLVGIRCFIPLQRRLRGVVLSRKLFLSLQKMFTSPKIIQFVQRHVRLLWKFLLTAYSKTNASKIVNRCKKYIHAFLHPHHDNEDYLFLIVVLMIFVIMMGM